MRRPLGRLFAALAFHGGLTPNAVTGVSALFTAAGIGMLLGLLIYLLGQPWVREIQETGSQAAKTVSHPSSLVRAVSSATLSVGAYASKPGPIARSASLPSPTKV